jgi:hypothetical protein
MKTKAIATGLLIAIAVATSSHRSVADERIGDAALGALSGAVVLGPVGAAAGAVVGYTMGPSIARGLGIKKRKPRARVRTARPAKATVRRVSARSGVPAPPPRPLDAHGAAPRAQTNPVPPPQTEPGPTGAIPPAQSYE